ncbi:hypothetical protein BGW80DRAFT_1439609 [Lactifluus volemus]|nr:hypothetical protein BGW80DRAFT_1439609 [Lactifluus volemus]
MSFSYTGRLPCTYPGCPFTFKSQHGRTYHIRSTHINSNAHSELDLGPDFPDLESTPDLTQAPEQFRGQWIGHPYLTGLPCDANGKFLPPGTQPAPRAAHSATPDDWSPFESRVQFLVGDLLYRRVEMSASNVDMLMDLWEIFMDGSGVSAPFRSHQHMHAVIDSSPLGDVPWQCLTTGFSEDITRDAPNWQQMAYEVWFRDPNEVIRVMLDNHDFSGQFDVCPYIELDVNNKRRWANVMSANIAWNHCDAIAMSHTDTHGAMYCPIILGSDKTTVSVATGHVEYHPLYLSIGNLHNTVRCAHRNAVIPIAFLAILKCDRRYDNDTNFRKFKRRLFHASISAILQTLRPGMTSPVIRRCPDGHYRRVIYDLVAFIADYPEQVMLTGIVQGWCPKCTASPNNPLAASGPRTGALTDQLVQLLDSKTLWDQYGIDNDIIPFTADFPRADIHEMISPDLLHQVIKGAFKDHLVTWVCSYLRLIHSESQGDAIIDDIDRRIAIVPPFPGLRRFPHGRRFKQWTGDDSKALMKVYLPAIVGYVPDDMVLCISAFLDTCYIARRQHLDEDSLKTFDTSFSKYLQLREVFRTTGVRPTGFSLPRQHVLTHYHSLIQDFGVPAGLCSSITESRHITAVKKPWRRSNRYDALGQMLKVNERLDKLSATRSDFVARGMMPDGHRPPAGTSFLHSHLNEHSPTNGNQDDSDEDEGPVDDNVLGHVVLARSRAINYPRNLQDLAAQINEPDLPILAQGFLADQLHLSDESMPVITSKVNVFHSAVATFFAPSDPSGIRGMRRERVRSTPSWRGTGPRRDCVFVTEDDEVPGVRGLNVAHISLLFSFIYYGTVFPCALVEWFTRVRLDRVTGMWIVRPDFIRNRRNKSVVHLDALLRAAHLIPVYDASERVPLEIESTISLDTFKAYYVNKYIDHHAHEIAF